jgi:uncharacterized membrane protein HdeD (DUF308 family)
MNAIIILTIRAVTGIIGAVLITRFFHPKSGIVEIVGLAIFLVGIAYIIEAFRKRKKDREQ